MLFKKYIPLVIMFVVWFWCRFSVIFRIRNGNRNFVRNFNWYRDIVWNLKVTVKLDFYFYLWWILILGHIVGRIRKCNPEMTRNSSNGFLPKLWPSFPKCDLVSLKCDLVSQKIVFFGGNQFLGHIFKKQGHIFRKLGHIFGKQGHLFGRLTVTPFSNFWTLLDSNSTFGWHGESHNMP